MKTTREPITPLLATFIVNISAASVAPISIKVKWLGFDEHAPFLGPLDTRTLLHATFTYEDM
jgi:hypothetical protein